MGRGNIIENGMTQNMERINREQMANTETESKRERQKTGQKREGEKGR
jgi:hypothetical protein